MKNKNDIIFSFFWFNFPPFPIFKPLLLIYQFRKKNKKSKKTNNAKEKHNKNIFKYTNRMILQYCKYKQKSLPSKTALCVLKVMLFVIILNRYSIYNISKRKKHSFYTARNDLSG